MLGGCALLGGMVEQKLDCPKTEIKFMGGEKIFDVMDQCIIHKKIAYPFPKPSGTICDVHDAMKLDPALKKCIIKSEIELMLQTRCVNVVMQENKIKSVILHKFNSSGEIELNVDAVVDATGGAGGMNFCKKYGNGCVSCIMRCPTFGCRVSIAERAGVKELQGLTKYGNVGTLSSAYSLIKDSIAPYIVEEIERDGCGVYPVPKELVNYQRTRSITASGNADDGFAENMIVVDNGFAKIMAAGFRPLEELHKIPGFENARYAEPIAGGVGNAIRYMAITPHENTLQAHGVSNLFVAGEKVAANGIVEAAILGLIAGHNALCVASNKCDKLFIADDDTFIGSYINYLCNHKQTKKDLESRTHMWVGSFFDDAQKSGIYTVDKEKILDRINDKKLKNLLTKNL